MKTVQVFPPPPRRTQELRSKGWTHECAHLEWLPVAGHKKVKGALCPECGSVHYKWRPDAS